MIRLTLVRTLTMLASLSLAACTLTRGAAVLVGNARPPINPARVRLYVDLPAHYEKVALLSADSRNDFASQQNLSDAAIARLKEEAAKVGANGILIQGMGNYEIGASGVVIPTSRSSTMVGVATVRTGKQVTGIAVFVSDN